jgi:hypothetical protein
MIGSSDSNRREGQGGEPRGPQHERSPYQRHDRRNTNRQRGRVREMSVRENAKSNSHRKPHQVEPDGTGRKFMHLTRGDLARESAREVSRGRSSQESQRKLAGAKGRRTTESAPATGLRGAGTRGIRNLEALQLRQLPSGRGGSAALDDAEENTRGCQVRRSRAKGGTPCAMQ